MSSLLQRAAEIKEAMSRNATYSAAAILHSATRKITEAGGETADATRTVIREVFHPSPSDQLAESHVQGALRRRDMLADAAKSLAMMSAALDPTVFKGLTLKAAELAGASGLPSYLTSVGADQALTAGKIAMISLAAGCAVQAIASAFRANAMDQVESGSINKDGARRTGDFVKNTRRWLSSVLSRAADIPIFESDRIGAEQKTIAERIAQIGAYIENNSDTLVDKGIDKVGDKLIDGIGEFAKKAMGALPALSAIHAVSSVASFAPKLLNASIELRGFMKAVNESPNFEAAVKIAKTGITVVGAYMNGLPFQHNALYIDNAMNKSADWLQSNKLEKPAAKAIERVGDFVNDLNRSASKMTERVKNALCDTEGPDLDNEGEARRRSAPRP